MLRATPRDTACTPKPCRSPWDRRGPLGMPAAAITSRTRQAVMRLQGQSRASPRPRRLGLADAVHQVEGVEQGGRHGHGLEDAATALLEGAEHQDAAGEVDAVGGQGEGASEMRQPVACRTAQKVRTSRGAGSGLQEGAALVLGQVEAAALGVEQLHARAGLVGTVHISSVSTAASDRRGAADRRRRGRRAGRRPGGADTELPIVYHPAGPQDLRDDTPISHFAPYRALDGIPAG